MPWDKPYKPASNFRLDPSLYEQTGRVAFITIRSYLNTTPFTNPTINEMVVECLQEEQNQLPCDVYTYCLMPNHLHFLIGPKVDGISVLSFVDGFKGRSTNRSWQLGWRGKLWQPRYYDHLVRTDESLVEIADYILNNPVRKNLVSVPEEWEWSGHFAPLPIR